MGFNSVLIVPDPRHARRGKRTPGDIYKAPQVVDRIIYQQPGGIDERGTVVNIRKASDDPTFLRIVVIFDNHTVDIVYTKTLCVTGTASLLVFLPAYRNYTELYNES